MANGGMLRRLLATFVNRQVDEQAKGAVRELQFWQQLVRRL